MISRVLRYETKYIYSTGLHYLPEAKSYLLLSLHSDRDGNLSLKWYDKSYRVEPSSIRSTVLKIMDYNLLDNCLIITPCYPRAVLQKYKRELLLNNIAVVGNWSSPTIVMDTIDKKIFIYNGGYSGSIESIMYLSVLKLQCIN